MTKRLVVRTEKPLTHNVVQYNNGAEKMTSIASRYITFKGRLWQAYINVSCESLSTETKNINQRYYTWDINVSIKGTFLKN